MTVGMGAAVDEMLERFTPAWATAGYTVELPGLPFVKPAITATWARWSVIHVEGGQRTLPGVNGRGRFGKGGYVRVECFTPLAAGLAAAYAAATIAVEAYEGKRTPSDVWFRNVRIDDEGQGRGGDAAWWSTVVVAEFVYDNAN